MKRIKRRVGHCAPFSLRILSLASESKVIKVCKRHGWNDGIQGMRVESILDAGEALGLKYGRAFFPKNTTLKQFCLGRRRYAWYLLITKYHTTVAFRNHILDNGHITNLRLQVQAAFPIKNSPKKPRIMRKIINHIYVPSHRIRK